MTEVHAVSNFVLYQCLLSLSLNVRWANAGRRTEFLLYTWSSQRWSPQREKAVKLTLSISFEVELIWKERSVHRHQIRWPVSVLTFLTSARGFEGNGSDGGIESGERRRVTNFDGGCDSRDCRLPPVSCIHVSHLEELKSSWNDVASRVSMYRRSGERE